MSTKWVLSVLVPLLFISLSVAIVLLYLHINRTKEERAERNKLKEARKAREQALANLQNEKESNARRIEQMSTQKDEETNRRRAAERELASERESHADTKDYLDEVKARVQALKETETELETMQDRCTDLERQNGELRDQYSHSKAQYAELIKKLSEKANLGPNSAS